MPDHSYGVLLLLIHSLVIAMIMWSLVKTWCTNPGFVTDFFKGVMVKETIDQEVY